MATRSLDVKKEFPAFHWLTASTPQIMAPGLFWDAGVQCCGRKSCMPRDTSVFDIEIEFEFSKTIYIECCH